MSGFRIPFNRPSLVGDEPERMLDAVKRGHISGDGFYTRKCQEHLERVLGASKVLLTTSCTHALEMAALLLDLRDGDEVLVPSFTFPSTANAFALRGARPVFVDVRADTLNLDESRLSGLISERTRAIVAVHYGGVGCDMDAIMAIAGAHQLAVVEDNAHGLFGRYKMRPLGSIGSMATQSFHETKNVTCGEGGALVINDARFVERAEIIREKGTNRTAFFRGQVDEYTWKDLGSSYLPSDMLAAFLLAQLEQWESIQSKRKRIWEYYHRHLSPWAAEREVRLPFIPPDRTQAYHLFYLLMPTVELRNAMLEHLRGQGILSVFHYLPLHLSDMGRGFGGKVGDCPITEDVSGRLLRLPFYNTLTEAEQAFVVESVEAFAFKAALV